MKLKLTMDCISALLIIVYTPIESCQDCSGTANVNERALERYHLASDDSDEYYVEQTSKDSLSF